MSIILLVIGVVVGLLIASAVSLGLSKLFKITTATYPKWILISFLMFAGNVVIDIFFKLIGAAQIFSGLLNFILSYLILAYLLKKFYKAGWKKSLGIYASQILIGFLIALCIIVPIRLFVFEPFIVNGQSMSPHYNNGDHISIEKFDRNFSRDDVIVFKTTDGTYLIKRIVGLPSEELIIKNGQISVNGNLLPDNYIAEPIPGSADIKLVQDEYFVLGDNSSASVDSRTLGPVKLNDIVGRVVSQ